MYPLHLRGSTPSLKPNYFTLRRRLHRDQLCCWYAHAIRTYLNDHRACFLSLTTLDSMWPRKIVLRSTWRPCKWTHARSPAPMKTSLWNSTTEEPSIGLVRFIARLKKSVLYGGPTESDIQGGTAIEGSDVFLVGDQTRSKCSTLRLFSVSNTYPPSVYSSKQFIDDQVHGVRGTNIGTFVFLLRNITTTDPLPQSCVDGYPWHGL